LLIVFLAACRDVRGPQLRGIEVAALTNLVISISI